MTKNVFPCGPLGQLELECLWGGGGVLLADPWEEGNSSKGGGQSQAGEDHPQRSVDNHDHREATASSPQWSCQIQNVQDGGPGTSAQQARHRPHWAADSAQRKLGKSPQQDSRAIKQSLISSFASCPQAQQPQCWLLALCQTHSCSCPRKRCEASTGASYPPSRDIPTPLLTSVSPLFIGLFTGRAVTGKKKRETWGHFSALRGEPSPSRPGSLGVYSPLCSPSKGARANFVSIPRLLLPRGVSQRLH